MQNMMSVGKELSAPRVMKHTMMIDTGSRSSIPVVTAFDRGGKNSRLPSFDIGNKVLTSRTEEGIFKRPEPITSSFDERKLENLHSPHNGGRYTLDILNRRSDQGLPFSKMLDRTELKVGTSLDSIKATKALTDMTKKIQFDEKPDVNKTMVEPQHRTNLNITAFARNAVFDRTVSVSSQNHPQTAQRQLQTSQKQPQAPQRYQFSSKPQGHQGQPVNLKSLVSNMELLKVPSRVLRYDNDHMLKSLGYSFQDSRDRFKTNQALHTSAQALPNRPTTSSTPVQRRSPAPDF